MITIIIITIFFLQKKLCTGCLISSSVISFYPKNVAIIPKPLPIILIIIKVQSSTVFGQVILK